MIKITKRVSALLLVMILLVCSCTVAFATTKNVVLDNAKVFSASETEQINQKLDEFSELGTDWQIVIYTSYDDVDSSDMEYYYNRWSDKQNFADNNVVFVIDRGSDNRIILTHGTTMGYFSDQRMSEIKDEMRPHLSEDDLFGATLTFVEKTKEYCELGPALNGSFDNVMDADEKYEIEQAKQKEKSENPLLYSLKYYGIIFGAVAFGLVLTFVLVNFFRYKNFGKNNTYDLKANSSLNLTSKNNVFLRRSVTVVDNSRSSSSGGSGSSGSSHGSSGSF